MLTAGDDGTAKLWDLKGNFIQVFKHSGSPVTCAAFSWDDNWVVTGGADKMAIIWNANGKRKMQERQSIDDPIKEIEPLQGHADRITSIAFSPDGRRIITGSIDRTAKVWDSRTGNQILTLQGHRSGVTSVAFSARDGKPYRVLTGSADNTARIWLATPPVADKKAVLQPDGRIRNLVQK